MHWKQHVVTLEEFIIQRQLDFPFASGELSNLLRDIGYAAKVVHREVNKAGLVDILGSHGTMNVQGEDVKKLDVYANEHFIASLRAGRECAGVGSEENDEIIAFDDANSRNAQYVVLMDPLDGSSNIDVNVSIGTIFSIYRRKSNKGDLVRDEDFLQKGTEQVAAGYVIYGSSTMLVYTTGKGVNGFTLDPSIGEFCLSNPNIKTPELGKVYSVNQGYYSKFPEGIRRFIDYCVEDDQETKRPWSMRYIGSMVADIHRNLIKGGLFMYPPTTDAPNGKLRLLYECNPIAFIVEQAGGKASTGHQRILELQPTELHQRAPVYLGSSVQVQKAEDFLADYESRAAQTAANGQAGDAVKVKA
jgi:fructose-1,6-bisphosphatase I